MTADSLIKRLKIVRVIPETTEARSFVLQPMDDWLPQYRSGQFLTLVFYTPHGEKRRSFSITSSPARNEPLTITVKKLDNGEFSRRLVYDTREGDILYTSGISGFFVLPANESAIQQYFFLAAGSGITPCFSLIKTVLYTTGKKLVLIYSNRSKADTIFYSQLKALQQEFKDRFVIHFLFSDIFNVHHSRLSNWLLQLLLKEYSIAMQSAILFYICGPFGYMQMVDITLKASGIAPHQLIKENFSYLPRIIIPRPPDTQSHKVTIHFNSKTYQLRVQYPQTILAAAKKQGISLPYSCEAGRCGSCAATCISGKIWMAYNEVLMDDEISKGSVLTCQSFPVGGDAEIIC